MHWLPLIIYLQFWHSRQSGIHKQPQEVFLKIFQNSQEAPVLESLIYKVASLQGSSFTRKTTTNVFSCEIWEIPKNTYFEEHLNDCFCVLTTSSYIDFYNPLQYTFYIFTNNFFITQLKQ